MKMLSVTNAIGLATDLGMHASAVMKLAKRRIPFSVAITSVDPAPTVSVRRDGAGRRASDMLLGERDQFGSDSWDYPAWIATFEQSCYLRLEHAGRAVDVPLLTPPEVALANRRWPEHAEAPAVVARLTWDQALAELVVPAGAS